MTQPQTRAQRLAMPLARDVVRQLAVDHGGCVRPIQLRRTDLHTGATEPVLVPCGHTLASVCPSCAERAKTLRAAQCREGWHLDREPIVQADDPDDEQRMWVELRARRPAGAATRPTPAARTPPRTTRRSGTWTSRSPARGCAATSCPPGRSGVIVRPGAARTPRTCPAGRSPRGPSARPTKPGTGRRSGRRCSSPSPAPATGAWEATAPRPTRPATTTSGRPGTRCTSPRCSTGSSRTCAASSATTSSTSPRSSRSGGWPRISTSPCAAPCPAPSCARCSPPPTTRSGGHPPTRSSTTTPTCRLA